MGKIVATFSISLDGVVESPDQRHYGYPSSRRSGFACPANLALTPILRVFTSGNTPARCKVGSDMADRQVLIPGPNHPITVAPNPARVVVTVAGKVVADTIDAVELREASYPAVQYIPLNDVDTSLLERSDHTTWCPYKGVASYYSIPSAGEALKNAVWVYESPHDAVAEIKGLVAFYPDRVDSIVVG